MSTMRKCSNKRCGQQAKWQVGLRTRTIDDSDGCFITLETVVCDAHRNLLAGIPYVVGRLFTKESAARLNQEVHHDFGQTLDFSKAIVMFAPIGVDDWTDKPFSA